MFKRLLTFFLVLFLVFSFAVIPNTAKVVAAEEENTVVEENELSACEKQEDDAIISPLKIDVAGN